MQINAVSRPLNIDNTTSFNFFERKIALDRSSKIARRARDAKKNGRCLRRMARSSDSELAENEDDDFELIRNPDADPLDQAPEDEEESRQFALDLARVCWDTKGDDTIVLHVSPLVYWTRYMVITTVFSRPQMNAILAKAEKAALESHGRRPSSSAQGRSAWELLDYGDVVMHVLTAEERDYYDLESFYGAAEEVELPFAAEAESRLSDWQTKL